MTFPLTFIFILLVFWRPQEWLFPWMFGWPFLDVVTYSALISLAFECTQSKTVFPKTPAVMLAAGLFFASIMSHVAHGYFQGVMDTIPVTFKLCFFLVLLLIIINSVQRLQGVVIVMLLGASVMAVHAIMQFKTGAGFAGQLPMVSYYGPKEQWIQQSRFFGIFDDPNDLGQYLASCVPLAFAFTKRLRFPALVIGVAAVWLLAEGMLATLSRGTLVAVIVSVGFMIILKLPSRWMPTVAGLILIGGLVACGAFGSILLDGSARNRVMYWGEANQYFKTAPIFGGGFGMFGEITGTNRAAHNAYVLCYTELGLFGYWFWFNILMLGFIGCWRTRIAIINPQDSERIYLRRVAGLGMVSLAGFAVSSYFLSRAFLFPLFFLFGLLNSVPMIAQRYLPHDHPPLVNLRKDVYITGTIATLVSVAYIYISILLLNR